VYLAAEPWNAPVVLARIWCLWELYCADAVGAALSVCLSEADEDAFVAALVADGVDAALIPFSKIDCKSAQATNQEDLEKISREIERTIGFGALDAKVVGQLRNWVVDTVGARLEVVRAAGSWDELSLRLLLRHVEMLEVLGRYGEAEAACTEGLRVAGGLVCTLISGEEENDPADVEALFAMFDADGDGLLSKDKYEAYLRGIREWGCGNYTDEKCDKRVG